MAEVRAKEFRVKIRKEEEENCHGSRFHSTLLSGKLRQAVCWATNREGGECLLLGAVCTNIGRSVADFLW